MAWIGEMLVEGLADSISANGDDAVRAAEQMSQDINDVMDDLARDMSTALPSSFDAELQAQNTGNLVNGLVSGLASVMNGAAASAQPIVLQVCLDSKVLAQTLFDPLRGVAVQRGVSYG